MQTSEKVCNLMYQLVRGLTVISTITLGLGDRKMSYERLRRILSSSKPIRHQQMSVVGSLHVVMELSTA